MKKTSKGVKAVDVLKTSAPKLTDAELAQVAYWSTGFNVGGVTRASSAKGAYTRPV
jgi:hypothetical protein